jgi:hypothetical protein
MNGVDRVVERPFRLRETVFRSDRYRHGCLCPGTNSFDTKRCRRCAGPFIVTMVKEVWPAAQTGWVVNVKDEKTGEKYVGLDSSWFRRTTEK